MAEKLKNKICSAKDCLNKHYGKGLCEKHYTRQRRHKSLFIKRNEPCYGSLQERFNSKFNIDDDNCWLWTGSLDKDGYGFLMYEGKAIKAHRYAFILNRGEIPEDLQICHSCDIRNCVNPNHLFLGTQKDNMQDAMKKGRHSCQQLRIIK